MGVPRYFLIAGGTGRQGGAAVNALLADKESTVSPEQLYVITRDIAGSAASKLASKGINLVSGVLGQPNEIFEHLKTHGAHLSQTAIFLAQAHGPTELNDARLFIDAAVKHGSQYFVYSSVDRGGKELSDHDPSYCKTFADKFHIEKHLISTTSKERKGGGDHKSMDYTILRPVWFADNALWGFPGRLCMTGWKENMHGKRMQIVTTKDIGSWAAEALLRPDKANLRNTAVSIASDVLDFEELDRIFQEETGKGVGVTYGWLARVMIWLVTDLRTMFGFINEREYGADLEQLSKTVQPTTFRHWVREAVGRTGRS